MREGEASKGRWPPPVVRCSQRLCRLRPLWPLRLCLSTTPACPRVTWRTFAADTSVPRQSSGAWPDGQRGGACVATRKRHERRWIDTSHHLAVSRLTCVPGITLQGSSNPKEVSAFAVEVYACVAGSLDHGVSSLSVKPSPQRRAVGSLVRIPYCLVLSKVIDMSFSFEYINST